MHAGRIVEQAAVADIVQRPRHPYTIDLLESTVDAGDRGKTLAAIPGAPPDLAALPPGCAFASRCRHARDNCHIDQPPLALRGESLVACWYPVTTAFPGAAAVATPI